MSDNFETLVAAVRESPASLEILRDISQVALYTYAEDASGALRRGCILLSVAPAPPEENSDGFLFLVGLLRDVHVGSTGSLSMKFREQC